jgi:hypothetical protein
MRYFANSSNMKKFNFMLLLSGILLFAACSNEGAFSEEEKKKQDSADAVSQEDQFKKLESAGNGDTSLHSTNVDGKGNAKPVKPSDLPGNRTEEYVPPTNQPAPKSGEMPPAPPPQQPKR